MVTVRTSSRGLSEVGKSREVRAEINALAERVASNLRSLTSLPIQVFTGTTDRARASVQITHPGGKAEQARGGVISQAASSAGLRVNSSE